MLAGSDVYSPSVTVIATSFGTSINLVQWSMTVYMIGAILSQVFFGALAEILGRKKPILLGLMIAMMGLLISTWASSILILIIGRGIQGFGAGACSALCRAIFRDPFSGNTLERLSSYVTIAVSFIIPAAPALGG